MTEVGRHARPRPGTADEAFRRAHPSHRCWRISTCAGLCWHGRSSGLSDSLGSRIVTYADDLVILCKTGKAEEALSRLRAIMGKLKLTVNEEKTRICKVPEGEFDFLGYTFGRMYSATTGTGPYWACGRRRRVSGAWSKRSMR